LHESLDVPEPPRVTLVGDREQVRPNVGDTELTSVTVPVKPPRPATLMVVELDTPGPIDKEEGKAEIEKSGELCCEYLHAVSGWSSQPEKLCPDSVVWNGSQKTKPCISIWIVVLFWGLGGAIPADFQAWSISKCILCM